MMSSNLIFTRISKVLLPLLTFLLPLIFLPFLQNAFIFPKILILVLTTVILLFAYFADALKSGQLPYNSKLSFPLFTFAVAIGTCLILSPEGRLESFLGSGLIYLSLTVLSFLLLAVPNHEGSDHTLTGFTLGTSLLGLFSTLQLTLLYSLSSLPAYLQARSFSPVGTPLAASIILLLGGIISFTQVASTKNTLKKYLHTLTGILSLIALVAYLALMLPGQELSPLLLPFRAGWNILLEAWKSPRILAFGVGLSNFPLLFTQAKPLFLNATPYWNTLAQTSSSEALELATTGGLLSIGALALLFSSAVKASSTQNNKTLTILLLASILLFTLLPSHIVLLSILFIGLGSLKGEVKHLTLPKTATALLFLIFGSLGLYTLYLLGLTTYAEYEMRQAQIALNENNGAAVYSHNLKAVQLMPLMTSYRISYSQVNLSLAGALSQKQTLSDTDKGNITQLAAQAVRESKLATDLRPNSAQAWNNLGIIYRNLINVADGADQYALTSYAKAVSLDPGNASLHVEFGGLLQQLSATSKDDTLKGQLLSRSAQEYQTAIQLKSDYANAYYNLSKVLETAKDYTNAYSSLQKAISLLGPDSSDLARATSELETLKGKLPKPTPSPSASPTPTSENADLSTPSPLPSPISGEPIPLP